MSRPVVPLHEARDADAFGAKTATLAALARRYRVPNGFAVPADVDETEIGAAAAAAYAALSHGTDAGGAGNVAVAVRSSAIGEDSRDASFAGQHETILGVRGADAVVEAIFEVRRSATSERAAAYRRRTGITEAPRVGVLVQRMVDADASVIAFTADPVTGDRDLVVINACRGLGDVMASGEVTPDVIQLRKADLEPDFSEEEGAVLSRDQVREVARLALDLEREAGHAVDIEAAFAGGALYLLQSRPVTAIAARAETFPVEWPRPGDEEISWSREDAHFSEAWPPLSIDYARLGPSTGLQRRNVRFGIPMEFRYEEFNGYIYEGVRMGPRDVMERVQREMVPRRRAASRALMTDWSEKHLPAVLGLHAAMRALGESALTSMDPAAAWLELWEHHSHVWDIHMTVTGGAYPAMHELHEAYEKLTGRPGLEALALTQGRAATLQQLQRDTFALVETARALPRIAEAIRGGVDRLDVLTDLPGGERFGAAVATFLERHGDIGQVDLYLLSPSWADDPATLVREVRRALEAEPQDPDLRLTKLLSDSEATLARAHTLLRDRLEDRARLDELVAVAQAVGPLTEEHNYWIDRLNQAAMHRAVLAFGQRLVADGSIERADDIVHFYVNEVAELLRAPRDMRAFVREREARHARNRRLRPPSHLGAKEAPQLMPASILRLGLGYKAEQDEEGVLKGVGASAGIGRGPARLVSGPADLDRVRAGDVLVCRSSTVSFVPVYGKVAAVVTEVGGALSHAAVVAREFGVPCVVATAVALTVLRDGENVEVDGTAGVVRRAPAGVVARS